MRPVSKLWQQQRALQPVGFRRRKKACFEISSEKAAILFVCVRSHGSGCIRVPDTPPEKRNRVRAAPFAKNAQGKLAARLKYGGML